MIMLRIFWSAVSVMFPIVRDMLLSLGVIWHEKGRQRFLLGRLAPGRRMEDFLAHLHAQGFGNHFISWVDDGELYSLRKIASDRRFQYHLRIFKDREVRGHYEFTPEAHPIWHFTERGIEARRREFLDFFADFVIPGEPEYVPAGMRWPLTGKIPWK